MIKSIKQAIAVQTRRVKSGKRGYARAVRRFIQAEVKSSMFGNYKDLKGQLPVVWPKV